MRPKILEKRHHMANSYQSHGELLLLDALT
jgi:hypothetical protein